jgi:hypothetical protein
MLGLYFENVGMIFKLPLFVDTDPLLRRLFKGFWLDSCRRFPG